MEENKSLRPMLQYKTYAVRVATECANKIAHFKNVDQNKSN